MSPTKRDLILLSQALRAGTEGLRIDAERNDADHRLWSVRTDRLAHRVAHGEDARSLTSRGYRNTCYSRPLQPSSPRSVLADDERNPVTLGEPSCNGTVGVDEVSMDQVERRLLPEPSDGARDPGCVCVGLPSVESVTETDDESGMANLDAVAPVGVGYSPEARVLGERADARKGRTPRGWGNDADVAAFGEQLCGAFYPESEGWEDVAWVRA